MTLWAYSSPSHPQLENVQVVYHILSQREYPRTTVSDRGGPTVEVTQHAPIFYAQDSVLITQQVLDWWDEELARDPQDRLLTGQQKGLFTAIVAQLEEYVPPEGP